jgi:hypothetical protein
MDPIHAPTVDSFHCQRPPVKVPLQDPLGPPRPTPHLKAKEHGDLSNKINLTFGLLISIGGT